MQSCFENPQAWCFALRTLMGYPAFSPEFHATAWCASGRRDLMEALQVTRIAADMGRDVIHVAFVEGEQEPLGVSLAMRQGVGLERLPGLRLYTAGEAAPVELLANDRRWSSDPRYFLVSAKLPRESERGRGEAPAWRRWPQRPLRSGQSSSRGPVWVPPGGHHAEALPHEGFSAAA